MAATPCIDCCEVNIAFIELSPGRATLKYDADVSITIKDYPGGAAISYIRIEAMKFDFDDSNTEAGPWCTLAGGATRELCRARIAGYFKIRAVITVCGEEHITDSAQLEVKFPHYDQIVADPVVKELMEALWKETKRVSSTAHVWREVGTHIRLDTATDEYDGYIITYGPGSRPGYEKDNIPKIYLPIPEDIPEDPSPCDAGADYYVADFHTHPPSEHVPLSGEPHTYATTVGPSFQDARASRSLQLPGIAYDQLPNVMVPVEGTPVYAPPSIDAIVPGTPASAPAGPYLSNSNVTRRPTPEFRSSDS